jgi:hypothetical protein
MTVERLSISLPPDLAADIREAAEAAGWTVSVWVLHAAEDRLARDRSRRKRSKALEELLADVGPIPEEVTREVDYLIEKSGLFDPGYEIRGLDDPRPAVWVDLREDKSSPLEHDPAEVQVYGTVGEQERTTATPRKRAAKAKGSTRAKGTRKSADARKGRAA